MESSRSISRLNVNLVSDVSECVSISIFMLRENTYLHLHGA
jgi:hypothetical protein